MKQAVHLCKSTSNPFLEPVLSNEG